MRQARAKLAVTLRHQAKARRQQRTQRGLGADRRIDRVRRHIAAQRMDGAGEIADEARRKGAAVLRARAAATAASWKSPQPASCRKSLLRRSPWPHPSALFMMISRRAPARCRQSGHRCSRGRPRSAAGRAGMDCPRPRCSTGARPGFRRRPEMSRASTRACARRRRSAAVSPPRSRIENIPPNPPCIWRAATAWPGWDGSPGYKSCVICA